MPQWMREALLMIHFSLSFSTHSDITQEAVVKALATEEHFFCQIAFRVTKLCVFLCQGFLGLQMMSSSCFRWVKFWWFQYLLLCMSFCKNKVGKVCQSNREICEMFIMESCFLFEGSLNILTKWTLLLKASAINSSTFKIERGYTECNPHPPPLERVQLSPRSS